jgi:hypothetical protein
MVLVVTDVFPTSLPVWSLPCVAFVLLVAAKIFYDRSREFSKDVAKYMVIEYYLEVIERRDRTIELDFLDKTDRRIEEDRLSGDEMNERDSSEQFTNAADQLRTDGETDDGSGG